MYIVGIQLVKRHIATDTLLKQSINSQRCQITTIASLIALNVTKMRDWTCRPAWECD